MKKLAFVLILLILTIGASVVFFSLKRSNKQYVESCHSHLNIWSGFLVTMKDEMQVLGWSNYCCITSGLLEKTVKDSGFIEGLSCPKRKEETGYSLWYIPDSDKLQPAFKWTSNIGETYYWYPVAWDMHGSQHGKIIYLDSARFVQESSVDEFKNYLIAAIDHAKKYNHPLPTGYVQWVKWLDE